MKAIAHYEDGVKAFAVMNQLRTSGVHACVSGNVRTGYDLLVAGGKVEQAMKCLEEMIQ